MKYFFLYTTSLFLLLMVKSGFGQNAAAPAIVWQKTIGGSATDSAAAMCFGANKTIVVCGSSTSGAGGNKTTANFGGYDYWVVKLDSTGKVLWNQSFGGTKDDFASAIIATSDGGYLVGGTSLSAKSTTKSTAAVGQSSDYWVIKLDADGNKEWDKTLGDAFTDVLTALTELPSGNFVVGGYSYSDDFVTKTAKNIGSQNTADYWTLILDKSGSIVSQQVFGGTSDDALAALAPAGTSGFYAAGNSYSLRLAGYKTKIPMGNNDYWVVKSDGTGAVSYEGNFGGNRSDYLSSMQVLSDNSLVLAGSSNSDASGDKTGTFLGNTDFWFVKTKPDGSKQWDKTIGSTLKDYLVSVQQTKDKGFLLGGYSNSNTGNDKADNSRGGFDYWIVKTDSTGAILWDKTIGGSAEDKLVGAYEVDSNNYVVAGTSFSPQSGDKEEGTVGNTGGADYWILRLTGERGVFPVTLLSFTAKPQDKDVVLNWVATNTTGVIRFEVERSSDGVQFSKAGETIVGATETNYKTVDANAMSLPYSHLYYRLKMVNSDGSFTYSAIVPVQLLVLKTTDFKVMPNPVTSTLTVAYSSGVSDKVMFIMYSASGKMVMQSALSATSSVSTHTFNVSSLPAGVYTIVMIAGENNQRVIHTVIKK